MIVRSVSLDRARAAAESELAQLAPPAAASSSPAAPSSAAPVAAMPNRENMVALCQLALGGLSAWAASHWGEQWKMEEAEAAAIADPLLEVIELELGQLGNTPYARLYLALGFYFAPRALLYVVSPTPPGQRPATAIAQQPATHGDAVVNGASN